MNILLPIIKTSTKLALVLIAVACVVVLVLSALPEGRTCAFGVICVDKVRR